MKIRMNNRLIWIDIETTGLNLKRDRILEVAIIVTEADLTIVAESPVVVINQSSELLGSMDRWCLTTHGKNGLLEKVMLCTTTESQAEDELLEFLELHSQSGTSPMCGNNVGFDRKFINKYMPRLNEFFKYRNIDVSTINELARLWKSDLPEYTKTYSHRALDDIRESIGELRHYRENWLQ